MKLLSAMTTSFVLLQNALVHATSSFSSFASVPKSLRQVSQQTQHFASSWMLHNNCRGKQYQHQTLLIAPFPNTFPKSTQRQTSTLLCSAASAENQETLAPGSHVAELEIKKSRFVGYAKHVTSWKEAKEYIEEIKIEHPKCRHACVGFVCGTNPQTERSNDDGEPTGTAGAPILAAIKGEGLSNVVCVIIRYFGGIKLGAGGLIRAYGGAARLVLRESPKQILIPTSAVNIQILGQYTGTIYDTVRRIPYDSDHGGSPATISDEQYNNQGDLTLTVTCETQHVPTFLTNLQDSTKGTAIILDGTNEEEEEEE
mmetsp:Transcript_16850/g.26126  ORF Transcript_16850/g.26126 Transcript_16850/m.26126 type:complete len:313 (+) Transcript_16850:124-1062(+)|eukprot:CAMPEP_0195296472 /NCGR_PEP_ID=MMETSP0707-20130614/19556_1 /TAXON_ID=33640 /ORGANISM="Asterionellopsis glacialis, Strain CCMP134" /LENGTH=312 /DNA_ID=CAMNT_0040358001 /DNA_START=52 /DNA_END=990 /DNA_ORIENTATION=+